MNQMLTDSAQPAAPAVPPLAYQRVRKSDPRRLEPTLAHDLNNLLMSIVGHTHLAQRKLAEGMPHQEHLEQIEVAVEQAKQLVSQSYRTPQPPRKSRIQKIIREAADLLRATLPANVDLRLRVDEAAPALRVDEIQIHRLILNLARNAIHAMVKGGGELGITLDRLSRIGAVEQQLPARRFLRLEIRDQGEGIAPEIQKRIFEPRFTTRPGSGNGLGLASVAQIAKDHNAIMRIESFVGLGSRVHVLFPIPAD